MRFFVPLLLLLLFSDLSHALVPLDKNGFLNVSDFGAVGNGTADDTLAIQNAVDQALSSYGDYPPPILLTGRYRVIKSIIVNRPEGAKSELRFVGSGPGAGFFVRDPITIFDSTLSKKIVADKSVTYDATTVTGTFPADPVSEQLTFEGVHFEGAAFDTHAYVISGRFFRIKFINSYFWLINCISSPIYVQSFLF